MLNIIEQWWQYVICFVDVYKKLILQIRSNSFFLIYFQLSILLIKFMFNII